MSILVGADTAVMVQNITGEEGRFHTRQMLEYGTRVVAGTAPGHGGQHAQTHGRFNLCSRAHSIAVS